MTKKNIALGIANAILEVHAHQKIPVHDAEQPYYCHKHLSSHNIMLKLSDPSKNKYKVWISDLGSE